MLPMLVFAPLAMVRPNSLAQALLSLLLEGACLSQQLERQVLEGHTGC